MQQQYNISHLEQSSIYRCIKEILDLINEESTEDNRKGIVKVGFADWWGQTNLKESILVHASKKVINIAIDMYSQQKRT